jgi:hypothetical protein
MRMTAEGSGGFRGGHAQQPAKARTEKRDLACSLIGNLFRSCAKRTAMVEKPITASRNVIDLSRYRQRNAAEKVPVLSPRLCRHCGAALLEGEREEECSSAFNSDALRLRWQAAQILRGLV